MPSSLKILSGAPARAFPAVGIVAGLAAIKKHSRHWSRCALLLVATFAFTVPSFAAVTMTRTAVGSATNFPTNSISGANGTRAFSDVGTASGATLATGVSENRWTTNGVAWGEVFKWTGSTGATLSAYSMVVDSLSTGTYRPFLFDLGAVTFNTTGSTFNPSTKTNLLSNVTFTPTAISARTFVEFDFSGTDAITLTNGRSYAFGLLNTTTGNIVILRSNGVQADANGAPFQITSGGLTGTSATVPSYGAGVRNHFFALYTTTSTPTVPAVPTGLTATAGNAEVALGWAASSGATSYNVKRATTSGGPYTTLTSVTTTSYTNTGLTNGTLYHYVVSAVNSTGESANSAQASATPTGGGGSTPPYVYSVEDTGTAFPAPPLPTVSTAPNIAPLPDPFTWGNDPTNANGTRSTAFADWSRHRREIRAYIENYEIGTKKTVTSGQVTASYSGGTLTVTTTVNGQVCTQTAAVSIPAGATAPYAVCIGMNGAYGSVGSSPFTSRGIISVVFSHDQVTTYGNPATSNPYYRLYPDQNLDNAGQYSAWAWGVSRLIDGLALVKASGALNVDMNRISVTGCSYAGKMALFSGAFDERIALTIAQESGGGGATSWRFSQTEPDGTVEKIDNTDYRWFRATLNTFAGNNVTRLPDDHHMLMAMCAPRALFCTANTDYTWLSNRSAYVVGQAAAKTYQTLGIADRFGFHIDGGHGHCAFPAGQGTNLAYFLDKFLKGQTSLSQTIRVAPSSYSTINHARWTQWWGTSNPVLPP